MSAIKVGKPYKEVLEQVLRDLERRGYKLSQKEFVERAILLIANEDMLLEKLLRKPAKPEEVEALLDELEADLGVENTKEDAVRSLYLGAG